jgi:hypothetical protein
MTVGGTTASFMPLSGSTLGWTAGAGVEIALWSNWSAKLEYLHISANGATVFAPIPNSLGVGLASTPMEYRDNIVRVGLNYRFGPRAHVSRNADPPVIAADPAADAVMARGVRALARDHGSRSSHRRPGSG